MIAKWQDVSRVPFREQFNDSPLKSLTVHLQRFWCHAAFRHIRVPMKSANVRSNSLAHVRCEARSLSCCDDTCEASQPLEDKTHGARFESWILQRGQAPRQPDLPCWYRRSPAPEDRKHDGSKTKRPKTEPSEVTGSPTFHVCKRQHVFEPVRPENTRGGCREKAVLPAELPAAERFA